MCAGTWCLIGWFDYCSRLCSTATLYLHHCENTVTALTFSPEERLLAHQHKQRNTDRRGGILRKSYQTNHVSCLCYAFASTSQLVLISFAHEGRAHAKAWCSFEDPFIASAHLTPPELSQSDCSPPTSIPYHPKGLHFLSMLINREQMKEPGCFCPHVHCLLLANTLLPSLEQWQSNYFHTNKVWSHTESRSLYTC